MIEFAQTVRAGPVAADPPLAPSSDGGPRYRILFVLEFFWPQIGGVEVMFRRLIDELVARGHDCVVLTTRLPGTPPEEVRDGIRIVRIGNPARPSRYTFTVGAFRRSLELAREADLVHTTTYNAAPAAWLAATVRGKPALLTVHEFLGGMWHALPDTSWIGAAALRTFERGCVALPFASYVAVSRSTRNALRQAGVPDRKLATVYNGSDGDLGAPDEGTMRRLRAQLNPEGLPLVGYFGRPGITKGVEVLLDAFERLVERTPAKLLLLLGAHPIGRRERLAERARRRLGDAAIVLPSVPRDALPSYLGLCDCIAVPSLTEGFGFTTLEASALDRVVVASDAGSIPEVIFGRHLLVPPGDAPALAGALERALQGAADVVPPRTFPIGPMVDGYLARYAELIPARATGRGG